MGAVCPHWGDNRISPCPWAQFAMDGDGELFVLAKQPLSPAAGGEGAAAEGLFLLDHAWSPPRDSDPQELFFGPKKYLQLYVPM